MQVFRKKSQGIRGNQGAGRLGNIVGIIRAARRTICRVPGAGEMNKDEVIIDKEFRTTGLSAVENFRCHEHFEILVIRKYLDGMARTFKVVASMFHGFDDLPLTVVLRSENCASSMLTVRAMRELKSGGFGAIMRAV